MDDYSTTTVTTQKLLYFKEKLEPSIACYNLLICAYVQHRAGLPKAMLLCLSGRQNSILKNVHSSTRLVSTLSSRKNSSYIFFQVISSSKLKQRAPSVARRKNVLRKVVLVFLSFLTQIFPKLLSYFPKRDNKLFRAPLLFVKWFLYCFCPKIEFHFWATTRVNNHDFVFSYH